MELIPKVRLERARELSAAAVHRFERLFGTKPARPHVFDVKTAAIPAYSKVPFLHRQLVIAICCASGSLALIAFLYAQVIRDLFLDWWNEPNLSFGLLIPPLTLWVAWIRRSITLAEPAMADARGLYLTAAGCILFLIGELGAEFFLMRVSLWILFVSFLWSYWGLRRLKTLSFPLLLLATSIPLPTLLYNTAAAPLQLFASALSTEIAQTLGITVYRDGNVIHLANTSLGVQEACSGLNSLSALMVSSILFGFLICSKRSMRWLLLILSIPLAIAINIVRITGTAIIADWNRQYAEGFYHSFSGWLVFLVSAAILYGFAHLLNGRRRALV